MHCLLCLEIKWKSLIASDIFNFFFDRAKLTDLFQVNIDTILDYYLQFTCSLLHFIILTCTVRISYIQMKYPEMKMFYLCLYFFFRIFYFCKQFNFILWYFFIQITSTYSHRTLFEWVNPSTIVGQNHARESFVDFSYTNYRTTFSM